MTLRFEKPPNHKSSPISTNIVLLLAMSLIDAQVLFAQTGRANISGTVADSQGAVIAGATIRAINNATSVATSATSNEVGAYSILQLTPGTYTVKVSKEGFHAQQQEGLTLVAEQNAGVNFTLEPGQVTEQVTVHASKDLIHTESGEMSQTIDEQAIKELPLNGRNPAELVFLTPGTINILNVGFPSGYAQPSVTFPTETGASTNGTREGGTFYALDGAYNMDNYDLLAAPFPNPDATEQFTVVSNNFDARYGFAPGGVVSIVTKSGTNRWHGDVFEFLRNGGLNAKDYFTHLTNQIHRNQFGASLGGPLIREKLFVFGNYQGTRQSLFNSQSTGYMWTPATLTNGVFWAYCQSGFTNGLCNDRTPNPNSPSDPLVTDQIWVASPNGYPSSGVPLSYVIGQPASGSGVGGKYYPNNQIDPASFSPGAVAMANAISTGLTPRNQFGSITGAGYKSLNLYNEETARVDYNINDHHRISGRMFLNYFNQPAVNSDNLVNIHESWIADWKSFAGTWTWIINPKLVNNATPFYSGMNDHAYPGLVHQKPICFSQFIKTADPSGLPCAIELLTINGGYQSAGGFPGADSLSLAVNRRTAGLSDNLSISKGKQLIVSGVDVLRQEWYEDSEWLAGPLISFGGGPNGQFTGNGFSDFLLGDESFLEQGGGEVNRVRAWMIAPYATDQIKLTPRLTVTAGLRWEPWLSPELQGGRTAVWDPGNQSTRYPNAPLGMVFPGDRGVPSSSGIPSDYKRLFDPRVGIAWSPKALPNTSIRAAFGMYATPLDYSSFNHSSDTQPFSPTYALNTGQVVNGSPLPIIPFDDPWSVYAPSNFASPFPPFSNPTTPPGHNTTFTTPVFIQSGFALNYKDGRTYTWNTSIEHQFGSNWLAKVAYVGSESDHQSYENDANLGQPICGPVSPTCSPVTSNPRVNPMFSSVLLDYSDATADYNAGQFTLERRFANGLQFTANYTHSHTIDVADTATTAFSSALDNPGCVKCNRGNSYIDAPNVFVGNFTYETSSPRRLGGMARYALGGWQISGIYRAQSGVPFSIYCGCVTSWQDAGSDYPDFAPGITHVHVGTIKDTKYDGTLGGLIGYLRASDFVNAPQGRDGNIRRNPPGLFGPGVNTWDLGLDKNFRFTERYRFQFRAEMYNAFNRVTFSNPANSTAAGASFGLINSTNPNYPARVVQLAGKLYF